MLLDSVFAEKEAKRFKVKIAVLLILIREEEVLLLRRFNTGIDDGTHVLPMGCVNEGETATEAALREAQEETGVVIQPQDAQVCHVMYRFHRTPEGYTFPQVDLFFHVHCWEGDIVNNEPDKCDELKFYSLQALPKSTLPFIVHGLECIQNKEFFSEFGWV